MGFAPVATILWQLLISARAIDYKASPRQLIGFYGGPLAGLGPNTGPQWVDYPAFTLSQPPRSPILGATDSLSAGGMIGNKKGGKKKGPPPPFGSPVPLFDVAVEPEYIPDPFPVPYPFPVDFLPSVDTIPEPSGPSRPRYRRQQYIERAIAEWTCPRDYVQEGQQCVKMDSVSVELGCAEGWHYGNGHCNAMDVLAPDIICDDGFVPWHSGNECVREVVAPKQINCALGFLASADGCKQSVESPAVGNCGEGAFSKGKCRKSISARPLALCPKGFTKLDDPFKCFRERHEQGMLTCPSSAHVLTPNRQCEKTLEISPQKTCPNAFHLIGDECIRDIVEVPTKTCVRGELHPSGKCQFVKSVGPSKLSCPNTAVYNAHSAQCEQTVEAPPQHTCPSQFVWDPLLDVCTQRTRALGKGEKKKAVIPPVVQPVPAHISCPPDFAFTVDGHACVGTKVFMPSAFCPPPAHAVGTDCQEVIFEPATLLCPAGSTLEDQGCCTQEVVAPTSICPHPYLLSATGKCVHVETSNTVTKCPVGLQQGLESGTCYQAEQIEASLECPPLTVLSKEHSTGWPVCQGEEVSDPFFTCNIHGMELDLSGPTCRGVHIEAPVLSCPPTFTVEEGRCIKYDVTPKRAVCPAGYTISFDVCIKEVSDPPLLLCPDGYQLHPPETCVRKRHTDLIPVCPADMQFDSLVGECYVMKVDYAFDELNAPASTSTTTEALKDLPGVEPTPPPLLAQSAPATPNLPAPQLTIVQQPVVVPQPAVILPQQAPVPPPPAIRVPYAVPQPIPVPDPPKHQHLHQYHYHHTDVVQPVSLQPVSPVMLAKKHPK